MSGQVMKTFVVDLDVKCLGLCEAREDCWSVNVVKSGAGFQCELIGGQQLPTIAAQADVDLYGKLEI